MTPAGTPSRGGAGLQEPMPEIQLPVFQGPLDLLLHLIERDDLDITAVSLVAVTDQYLKAIHASGTLQAGILADFVAIGAKLIYLKSRALLPRPALDELPLEEDEVGQELVDLLLEYRRFAGAADVLQERQEAGLRVYPRLVPAPVAAADDGPGLDGVTLDAMRAIMLEVLDRVPPPPRVVVPRDRMTLSQRIGDLRNRLASAGRVSFRSLMLECRSRIEVVLSFLAILELLKSGECDAEQSETWGDIDVVALSAVAV